MAGFRIFPSSAVLLASLTAFTSASAEIGHVGLANEKLLCIELVDGKAVHVPNALGRIEAASVVASKLDDASSYRIAGGSYGEGKNPSRAGHKSNGSEFSKTGDWNFSPRFTHWIYLEIPEKLQEGVKYKVTVLPSVSGGQEVSREFIFKASDLRSESIHCTQIGFVPSSPKSAFLSCWAGTLGSVDFRDSVPAGFLVVDAKGETAYKGEIRLRRGKNEPGDDAYKNNFQGCDLYEMDFTGLSKEGRYKIVVPGIGSSFTFAIGQAAYAEAYRITTRGLYYQRCGCELDAKNAGKEWARPACHSPKAGKEIEETTLPLPDALMGGGKTDQFKELPKRTTGKKLDYWGGWHDAGDFDRRAGHLLPVAMLLDVYEIFPAAFKDGDLNIPESGNGIPDMIDEVLWCVDFFKRGQNDDGGVRGGIESEDHPPHECNSYTDPLHLYAYAPDAETSYRYAWVAAKCAAILQKLNKKDMADKYLKSAENAWGWAIRNDGGKYRDDKNAASAQLFALTGKQEYHQAFKDTSVWSANPDSPVEQYGKFDQRAGAFSYVSAVPADKADEKLRNAAKAALLKLGDDRVDVAGKRAFRFSANYWRPLNWGLGSFPDVWELVRAYSITHDKKYADAIASTCSFTLGGNPLNMVWVTGLGEKRVTQVLHTDSWHMAAKLDIHDSVPGLVPSGPVRFKEASKGIHGFSQRSFTPPMKDWPPLEQYAGNMYDPGISEHTPVSIGMAAQAYCFLFGYGTSLK